MDTKVTTETESRIKEHGGFLVSMAHLGLLCAAALGITLLASTYIPQDAGGWLAWIRDEESSSANNLTSKLLFSLSYALLVASLLMPLLALRRLGRVLEHGEVLSLAVAEAFYGLARSVAKYYLLLQIAAGFIAGVASVVGDVVDQKPPYSFGDVLAWLFVYIVICVCLYSVAHLMKLAAQAADDSRSII